MINNLKIKFIHPDSITKFRWIGVGQLKNLISAARRYNQDVEALAHPQLQLEFENFEARQRVKMVTFRK